MKINHPEKEEYPERFQEEIKLVLYPDLISGLEESFQSTSLFLKNIPEDKLLFSYAAGKWTIKEIWQHVMDTERILAYRALCYSRKETKALPGFDENAYVSSSKANLRNWKEMLDEYTQVRSATVSLFKSFDEEMLSQIGFAGTTTRISTKAVGFLLLGHEIHHARTIRERYLMEL